MIALVSPSAGHAAAWGRYGAVMQFDSLSAIPDWHEIDVVVYDLHGYRLGTSTAVIDETRLLGEVKAGAQRNRDALWVVVGGPAMGTELAKVVLMASRYLLQGQDAVRIVDEPDEMPAAQPAVEAWLAEISRLEGLPINLDAPRDLSRSEWRCIRRLMSDVDSVVLRSFGHGRGDALTLGVERVLHGSDLPRQVLKIGPRSAIEREHENYQLYVQDKLGNYRYPQHTAGHLWFCGDSGALVYSYVGDPTSTPLADAMRAAGADCTAVIEELFGGVLEPWLKMRLRPAISMARFVDLFLRGYGLQAARDRWASTDNRSSGVRDGNPIDWIELVYHKDVIVDIPWTIAHGDLHGYNVLVDSDNHPWLIDFFWTGEYCGIFDFAYADVFLLLNGTFGGGPEIIDCSIPELENSERESFQGGAASCAELTRLRRFVEENFGLESMAAFHLARACTAIRLLRYETTDPGRAKLVAELAVAEAARLRPEWEASPDLADLSL